MIAGMTIEDVRDAVEWGCVYGKYRLLRKVCDGLVYMHVRTTPRSATEDTLNTIIQEQLASAVRRIEFKCHNLKLRYEELGKEILR